MKTSRSQFNTDHNEQLNVRINQGNGNVLQTNEHSIAENLSGKTLPRSRETSLLAQKKTVAGKELHKQKPEAASDVNNNVFGDYNPVGDVFGRNGYDLDGATHEQPAIAKQAEIEKENANESTGAEGQKLVDFEVDIEALPWHHLQLYNFMGKEADYFLHPKLDMDKRAAKPLTTPLRNKTGYNSVDTLWAALRQDSSKRLRARVDDNIHPDLKATYRAYIREYMKDHDTEDKEEQLLWGSTQVPEIEELLDDSRLRKITERRRKVQIMFRSALRNEDRTKILLYNNPLPDINNDSGTDNVMRFLLPSPAVTSHENNTGNESDVAGQLSRGPIYENSEDSPVTNRIGDEEITTKQDEFVSGDFDGPGKPKLVKCVFLTEADASSVGRFSRKRKELMNAKSIDTQYMQIQKCSQDSTAGPAIAQSTVATENLNKSSPAAASYQPLTLGALMEYATKYSVPGHGNFKFGTRPMWFVQEKTL